MFGTPISLRLVICVLAPIGIILVIAPGFLLPVIYYLAPIGIIYVTILIITRRISSSIEQSEARLTDAIAQNVDRLAASIEKGEAE